jgi:hypothetical protein
MQAAGVGLKAAGKGMEVGGKAVKRGGTVMVRAGAALSSTGIGALVGVPLAIAGGGVAAAGAGTEVAGRITNQVGKGVSKTGRRLKRKGGSKLKTLSEVPEKIKSEIKSARVSVQILMFGMWMYIFQLILAIASIVFLSFAYMVSEGIDIILRNTVGDGIVYRGISVVISAFSNAAQAASHILSRIVGVDILAMGYDTLMGLFVALGLIIFLIGLTILLVGSVMYLFSGINCFTGRATVGKICGILAILVGYLLPFFNLFPWFIFWVLIVWRYPK